MELFRLLGTIAINNEEANKKIDETTEHAESSGSKLGTVLGAVGSAAMGMAKVGATAVGAVAGGIATLTGMATKSYADYEQLIGGVQTLFNKTELSLEEYAASVGKTVQEVDDEWSTLTAGARFVANNSEKAFKTAGLSANAYMETVTSFSASLISSLGGDTAEAAKVADMAIIDMADNANKMGTSIDMIQNAYQGFAKQNYTMLDNLKLGYGGTKEEMARLIKDASKMKQIQKELGITIDANSMSFANIANAIHVMQTNMGIAGATAAEAEGTISGSFNMMKAAWENFMTSMSLTGGEAYDDALSDALDGLIESVVAYAKNIGPRLVQTVPKLVEGLMEVIRNLAPEIKPMLEELLPSLIDGAVNLVVMFAQGIPELIGMLIPYVMDSLQLLVDAITEKMGVASVDLGSIFSQIGTFFQETWTACQEIWETIGQPIWDAISVSFGIVYDAFAERMPEIREFVSSCFSDIQLFWEENLKPCFEAIGSFIETYLAPIFQSVFETRIKGTIDTVFKTIKGLWDNTLKPVFTGITDFLTGVFTGNWEQAWNGIVNIFKGIINIIPAAVETAINAAIDLLNGLISGANKYSEFIGLGSIQLIEKVALPRLENGGVLEKGQIGLLEGNGAEAVVPLHNNKKWISAVADDMQGAVGSNVDMSELIEVFEQFIAELPGILMAAFSAMVFEINDREFARLVKEV